MAEEQKQPPAQENTEPQQTAAEPQQPQQPQQAMESQVTSTTPATKPKNQKRVDAGKRTAEKQRLLREAQKQAYDEKMAKESAPAPEPAPETEPKPAAADSNGFTTNQLLTIVGFAVTLFVTYVKRDDIKSFFGKKQVPKHEPVATSPPQLKKESPPQTRKGIRNMD